MKVLRDFTAKESTRRWEAGEEYTGARVEEMIERGFVAAPENKKEDKGKTEFEPKKEKVQVEDKTEKIKISTSKKSK